MRRSSPNVVGDRTLWFSVSTWAFADRGTTATRSSRMLWHHRTPTSGSDLGLLNQWMRDNATAGARPFTDAGLSVPLLAALADNIGVGVVLMSVDIRNTASATFDAASLSNASSGVTSNTALVRANIGSQRHYRLAVDPPVVDPANVFVSSAVIATDVTIPSPN